MSETKPRKLTKPSIQERDVALVELNAELKTIDEKLAKLNLAINGGPKNGDSAAPRQSDPIYDRRAELQKQLSALVQKQGAKKSERNALQSEIRLTDASLKKKIADLNSLRGKSNFKSAEDIERKIKSLEDSIGSGQLKLVEEKRCIKEIQSLRKLKADFSVLAAKQESIDADKAKIAELKKKVNALFSKELNEEFEKVTKELELVKAQIDQSRSKKDALFQERNALRNSKDEIYKKINATRSEFSAKMDAYYEAVREERRKRQESEKAERTARLAERRKELAKEKLEAAAIPAFTTEIKLVHSLIAHYDPSYVIPKEVTLSSKQKAAPKKNLPEGEEIVKPKEVPFIEPTGGKKHKKKADKGKNLMLVLDPIIIDQLASLDIGFPTVSEEVPAVLEKLHAKLDYFLENSEKVTEENLKKAKAEVEALEAEPLENLDDGENDKEES